MVQVKCKEEKKSQTPRVFNGNAFLGCYVTYAMHNRALLLCMFWWLGILKTINQKIYRFLSRMTMPIFFLWPINWPLKQIDKRLLYFYLEVNIKFKMFLFKNNLLYYWVFSHYIEFYFIMNATAPSIRHSSVYLWRKPSCLSYRCSFLLVLK